MIDVRNGRLIVKQIIVLTDTGCLVEVLDVILSMVADMNRSSGAGDLTNLELVNDFSLQQRGSSYSLCIV